ncbi:hypothetical protein AURDEDRAFT_178968 [Auricularia subglabra TFB-10046 SS5]|nr:hypothetical protein AURDEDRAFT_178968 [Auricularia subglabra TFB-10046 SS5]
MTVGGLLGSLSAEERLGLVLAMLKHLEPPAQTSATADRVQSIADALLLDRPSVELAQLVGIRDASRMQQLTPPAEVKKETRDFGVQVTPPPVPIPPPRVFRDQSSATSPPPAHTDAGSQTTARVFVDRAASPKPVESTPQSKPIPATPDDIEIDDGEPPESLSRKLTIAGRPSTAPELIVEQELLAFEGLFDAFMHKSPFETDFVHKNAPAPPFHRPGPPIASPTPARAQPTQTPETQPSHMLSALNSTVTTTTTTRNTAEPTKKRKRGTPPARPPTPPVFGDHPTIPVAKRPRLSDASPAPLKRKRAEADTARETKRRVSATTLTPPTEAFVPEHRSMRLLAREISAPQPGPPPAQEEAAPSSPPVEKKRRGRPPGKKNVTANLEAAKEQPLTASSSKEPPAILTHPPMTGVQPKRTYLGRRKSQDALIPSNPLATGIDGSPVGLNVASAAVYFAPSTFSPVFFAGHFASAGVYFTSRGHGTPEFQPVDVAKRKVQQPDH